jgi:hypothetical protein
MVLALLMFSLLLRAISVNGFAIGVIRNMSLSISGANSTILNGTWDQCLCAITADTRNISSFNFFHSNNTCELFVDPLTASSVSLQNDSATVLYLLSLPKIGKISNSDASKSRVGVC